MRDIEINLTGNPGDMAYKMPWSLDATCYNFIKPKTAYKADKSSSYVNWEKQRI